MQAASFQQQCLPFFSALSPSDAHHPFNTPSSVAIRHVHRTTAAASAASATVITSATAATAVDDYQLFFASQPAETAKPVPLLASEGSLPADFPVGTYYLTGPGMTADDRGSTVSPIDGHGYLRAFRFAGTGAAVTYSARYVETEAAREERDEATGKWIFRQPGIFSMLKSGRLAAAPAWMNLRRNVANTAVLGWGGRLFCLWEVGHPYEIDPSSFETVGPADLIKAKAAAAAAATAEGRCRGLLAAFVKSFIQQLTGMPSKRTLSHYKIDAKRNMLIVVSCDVEDLILPHSNFTFYEFDCCFELKQKREFLIPDRLLVHDWAFTDSYYVLMGNRIKFDVAGTFLAITGLAPVISAVSLNPSQATTPIYLLPRFSGEGTPERDWRVPVEALSQLWTLHVGNAFEERDEDGHLELKIQASVCSYRWFNFKKMFGYDRKSLKLNPTYMNIGKHEQQHLVQISIIIDDKGTCRWCSTDPSIQWNKTADFPVINPKNSGQSNKFIYASSTSGSRKFLSHFPHDTIIKLDCSNGTVKSWFPGTRRFVGEPVFVSKETSEEEDGYIVVVEYAVFRQRCYLVVLDAKRIGFEDAVVVKLEVPEHLSFPFGFHGFWDGK